MIVKITNVQLDTNLAKRDGGTYLGSKIEYQKEDGTLGNSQFAKSFLNANSKLAAQLSSLQVGETYMLHREKKGMYWNILDISPVDGSEAPPASVKPLRSHDYPAAAKKTPFVDNSVGMQVGNAINNAAILLAHKQASGTLEAVAEDILRVGERLKQRLVAGEFQQQEQVMKKATPAAKKTTAAAKKQEFDFDTLEDDLPFDDE